MKGILFSYVMAVTTLAACATAPLTYLDASLDQETREASVCYGAALNQQSRVQVDSDFYRNMSEIAAYWRGRVAEKVVDPLKQEDTLQRGQQRVSEMIAGLPYTQGMFAVGTLLSECGAVRDRLQGASEPANG